MKAVTPRSRSIPDQRSRGISATELAIVLPVLMVLVLGAVDFARVFTMRQALGNAVRVAAGEGATHRLTSFTSTSWYSRVQAALTEELQDTPRVDLSKLVVVITPVTETDGRNRVIVSATLPFRTLVNWPGMPALVTLSQKMSLEEHL